jgi:hypothetical protein
MQRATKLITASVLLLLIGGCFVGGRHVQAAGDPNNFSIQSFDADYFLSKDTQQRSQMKVVETIVADFPDYDQNHGIERAIPDSYDGHNVHVHLDSVQDIAHEPVPYTTYQSNNNTVIRIGDANTYVHNMHTYVIAYDLHDITKAFSNDQELYWDANGTQWTQTFGHVTARVHVPTSLMNHYGDRYRCFEGENGSTESCMASQQVTAQGSVFTFQAPRQLGPLETLTFVIGFTPNTFVGYQPTRWERTLPWLVGGWITVNVLFLAGAALKLIRFWRKYGKSPKGQGVIIPEYVAPKDMSTLMGATILKRTGSAITAQIIDLAVRGYLKIYEADGKWPWKGRSFELELAQKPHNLGNDEQTLIDFLFPDALQPAGQRLDLSALSSRLTHAMQPLLHDVRDHTVIAGYFEERKEQRRKLHIAGWSMAFLGIVLIMPGLLVGGIAALIVASSLWQLSDRGVARRDYLRGLRLYMQVAEAERIKRLQTPKGAEKVVDPNDHAALVKLYERLLPYAIVFGIDQEWAKEFAPLYADHAPDWYVGNWATFNAVVFVASLQSFTAASTSTFAPSTNASASGFGGGGW